MKLNSKLRKTCCLLHNAIAYLMKWFNFNDNNYVKHIECLSLSREIVYEELQKTGSAEISTHSHHG
jgi:hypothetical protein